METHDSQAREWPQRVKRTARDWWPVPAFLATAVLAQQVLLNSRYDDAGVFAGRV